MSTEKVCCHSTTTYGKKINKRNDIQSFQSGFFRNDVPTFNERAVREALLNAVGHRDYQHPSSVFVKQYPHKLTVVSPGGLPTGITLGNILSRQIPRNRRIADALEKCNLIERSGQGMDLMVKSAVAESKPQPDFRGTDPFQVSLTLDGTIQNVDFLKFLEKVGQERLELLHVQDFLVLDAVFEEKPIPEELEPRLAILAGLNVIEKIGRGRGTHYIPSRELFSFIEQRGSYTRRRGLDRETHKALLLKHIKDNDKQGSKFDEFTQVLPELTRNQLQSLLRELKAEDKIRVDGRTKAAKWYVQRGI